MKTKPKYSHFAGFLQAKREGKYRSARDFCARVKLGVSYPQYSRYEAGEQLPSLAQALAIGEALGLDPVEVTLEWDLAQVEGPAHQRLQTLLKQIRHDEIPREDLKPTPFALDEVIVFNRSHRDLFLKDPTYRDIFTYVNSFASSRAIKSHEISDALKLSPKVLRTMLENLVGLGVILRDAEDPDAYQAAKSNFYFPDDRDFFELRQQNLRHNVEQILNRITFEEVSEKRALRTVATRELTASQLSWVMGQVDGLMGKVMGLSEDPKADTIYSVCAVVGPRFSR